MLDAINCFFFFSLFVLMSSSVKQKLVLKIIVPLIFIVYSIGLDNIIIFLITTNVLYYKIIGLIILVLTIFYYLSSIVLYILFSKNNISIPKNIPPFLNYWLSEIKVLSRESDYNQTLTRFAIEIFSPNSRFNFVIISDSLKLFRFTLWNHMIFFS